MDPLPHNGDVLEQVFSFQHQQLAAGEDRLIAIQLLQIAAAGHVAVLRNTEGITAGQPLEFGRQSIGHLQRFEAMAAGMEHLREGPLQRVEQHDQVALGSKVRMFGGLRMEEVVRRDIAKPLSSPGLAVMGRIPTGGLLSMEAEVRPPCRAADTPRVLLQQFVQAGGAAFGCRGREMGQAPAPSEPSESFGETESHRAMRVSVSASCSPCCVRPPLLLVVGMHRSSTSLLGGILQRRGGTAGRDHRRRSAQP